MTKELRPCPFCGRIDYVRVEAVDELVETGTEEDPEPRKVPIYAVYCGYCGAAGPQELDSDDAAVAWNRREGRTCQIVVSVDRNPASCGGKVHRCSACGKALPGALFRNGWTQLDYCPRCGARVTGVVRDAD